MPRRLRTLTATLGLFLAACPPSARVPEERPPAAVRGGTLRVLLVEDVDALDPHRAGRPSSWFFARALHRGLLAFPNEPFPDGAQPVPDLAESLPEVSADRLTYTFVLRAGVRFGAPASRAVRADDVVASLDRVRRGGYGIARALSDVESVQAPDARTVVLRLRRPLNDLRWVLAHPQVAILPATTPAVGRTDPRAIAGAGPYRLARYEPERAISLERNEAWDAPGDPVRAAYVDRIEATIGVSPARAEADVATGRADLVVEPGPPDAPRIALPAGARAVRTEPGCVRALVLDPGDRVLARRDARRAIAFAMQRERLLAAEPGGIAAPHLLPPTVFGSGEDAVIRQDVGSARRALGAAGLARGFETTLAAGASTRDRTEARSIARSVARAGIRLSTSFVHPALLYRALRNAPIGLVSWCADWPGVSGRNVLAALTALRPPSGVAAERLDRLLAAASAAREPARGWASADRTIVAGATVIPLVWVGERVALSPRIRGYAGAPMWGRGDPAGLWLAA